mmetsp:Transcript_14760/g.2452  ORF Transcript_14760/g.2452 Transcript_14760/m.2452 type:complete len:81 (-) Transcript_14760:420-662(-)
MVSKILGGKGKLIVTGLPHGLLEEEIKVLIEEHGELKCFDMPKDPITALTRGYAVFDYISKTSMASVLKQSNFRVSGVIA